MTDIIVHVGNCRYAFPEGAPRSAIDKVVKAAEKVSKQPTTLGLPEPESRPVFDHDVLATAGRVGQDIAGTRAHRGQADPLWPARAAKVVGKDMLEAAARVAGDGYTQPDRPEVVIDPAHLEAALLAVAHREVKKWAKDDPVAHDRMTGKAAALAAKLPREDLDRMLASLLKPGARLHSTYGASLIYGIAERDRRMAEGAA